MSIRFSWLWFMWGVLVAYHVAVSALGIFPSHTAAQRLQECFDIAFFIASCWLAGRMSGILTSAKGAK